ncbi:MAG TPA: hypothetical protein VGI39_19785 [Polyangiaceae bacterium]|jgi:predicted esterase
MGAPLRVQAAIAGWLAVLAAGSCRSPDAEVAPNALSPAATAGASSSPAAPPPLPVLRASTPSSAAASVPLPVVATDWCIDGLTPLDEETCYLLPDPADAAVPPPLLVYLHGIVPPTPTSPQKERVELAVLHAARRAHAAALVPRGVRGIGPSGAHDWWAWPTDPGAYAKYAAGMVAKWADARRRLERLAGAPFAHTYLAGSSNGAYFLTALALRGDLESLGFPVDGYGAMSGGSAGGRAASALPAVHLPFYVGYGTYDESTRRGARALAALLEQAQWPTKRSELPFGHGAREEYLDEAFAFWAREALTR